MRWNPNKYNATKDYRIQLFKELLNWANIMSLSNQSLLDIGCGDGSIDEYASARWENLTVTAIDSDAAMIDFANENQISRSINFKQVAAEKFQYENEFDIVISLACLHWVKDQSQVLGNIYRSLKPGGLVLLLICPEQAYVWKALTQLTQEEPWQDYFFGFEHGYYFYSTDSYKALSNASGFKIRQIELTQNDLNLESKKDFEKLISGWIPHLDKLPHELHESFLKATTKLTLQLMHADGLSGFGELLGSKLNVLLQKPECGKQAGLTS